MSTNAGKCVIMIILLLLMAGAAYCNTQTTGTCSTREQRREAVDRKLAAPQCDNYVCGNDH